MEDCGMRYTKVLLPLFVVFLTLGLTNMNAFGFLGFGETAKWKEEVLLHDGSKIIVERWQKRGGRHEIGQEPGVRDQSISFTIPGTKKVATWKDNYSEEIGRSNFIAVALHILDSIPYIITEPRLCLSYNKWGRPNPPYVIFKLEDGTWQRIDIPDLPKKFTNINLVVETQGSDEKELVSLGVVSSEKVKELNSSLTRDYEQYREIIRTPLKPGALGVSCPDWSSTRYTSPKAPLPISPESESTEK